MECVYQKAVEELNSVVESAVCTCNDRRPVCSQDGRTYKNLCHFRQVLNGRRDKPTIDRYEPCDEAPRIVDPPQDVKEQEGKEAILSCGVSGYPPPRVEWTLTRPDGLVVSMPSDDLRKSIQARGGPDSFQVTGWLLLQDLDPEDEGMYTCIGKNKLGEAVASASMTVRRRSGRDFDEEF